ncbi:pseudouridine synthase [Odoribacter sp. OttesenSCG-928-A06]|nr:pseudouridine synthase [Odoribacter sp. OttesenSCG-928-A06]
MEKYNKNKREENSGKRTPKGAGIGRSKSVTRTPYSREGKNEEGERKRRTTEKPFARGEARRPRPAREYAEREGGRRRSSENDRPYGESRGYRENRYDRENSRSSEGKKTVIKRKDRYPNELDETQREELRKSHYSKKKQLAHHLKELRTEEEIRLNRYISMSGICSRRDADELIKEGRVTVNGEVVQVIGTKVKREDRVLVDGVEMIPEKRVYLVLNKPKDFVTTLDDPLNRKTVMSLIEGACKERVYPVGRLDRQTTGVLLFTNDGELSKKLTHPSYEHKKIYHVFLDKPLLPKDKEAIKTGIELEDGMINADEIDYVTTDKMEVGIEIHSGRNRIVRRIFEHLGYTILRLDRVYFAGITKKNIPRGKWRFLTPEEVRILKIY